jgi:hypothetical protein
LVGKRLVAGIVLWGILSVACLSPARRAPGGAEWGGTIDGAEDGELHGRPLAWGWDKDEGIDVLYRVNPRTMQLREPFPFDAKGTIAADLSAGNLLLMATAKDVLQVIDLDTMRRTARVDPGLRSVRDAFWVADDVAILLVDTRNKVKLVRLRPSTGEILDEESVPGTFFAGADAGDGVVVLTHGYEPEAPAEPDPATLGVMDAAGEFATVRLDDVGAGYHQSADGETTELALPALAVKGSAATVVGTDGKIVGIDLDTLEATVEGEDDSVLGAIASWFVPTAHAKMFDGTELKAEWAGDDALLVSGYRAEGRTTHHLGALLYDADDWSVTVVDEEANGARVAGGRLLVWKNLMVGDERGEGIGLRVYGPDGELELQTLDGEHLRLQAVHRGVAYVEHGWSEVLVSSVDLETGEVIATRHKYVHFLSI